MRNIILLLFLLSSLTNYGQVNELTLLSDIWPPFTNVEGEKRISMDIVDMALNRDSVNVNFEIDDNSDIIEGIKKGKFDGSAALWYSEEREKELLFSDAYLHNQLILVGRKGSDVSAETFSDLEDVKIGLVENYYYGEDICNSTKVEIIKGKSDQKNLTQLLSKNLDYILVDALLIQYLINYQTNDVNDFLEIGETPLVVKSLHFAINKNIDGAEVIIENFNSEIKKMIVDGSYHEILDLNWIRADIDGDGKIELVLIGDKAGVEAPEVSYNINPSIKNTGDEGFYINGVYYLTWEQVPGNVKVKLTYKDDTNYHEGGPHFEF